MASIGSAKVTADPVRMLFTLPVSGWFSAKPGYSHTVRYSGPSFATPLHVQPEDDESFYVLEGELTFFLGDGRAVAASTGSFIHIPAGAPHAFQVDSETVRILDLTTPQHERFMRAAGEPARERVLPPEGAPDMEKVGAAAREYGVEILGPPPGAQDQG